LLFLSECCCNVRTMPTAICQQQQRQQAAATIKARQGGYMEISSSYPGMDEIHRIQGLT